MLLIVLFVASSTVLLAVTPMLDRGGCCCDYSGCCGCSCSCCGWLLILLCSFAEIRTTWKDSHSSVMECLPSPAEVSLLLLILIPGSTQ